MKHFKTPALMKVSTLVTFNCSNSSTTNPKSVRWHISCTKVLPEVRSPPVNFSLFACLAYQRYPEYIDKFLKRLVDKSFSELKEEGLAIMKAENIN
jgi:hypothetical protein